MYDYYYFHYVYFLLFRESRDENALKKWEQQQREWNKIREHLSKKTGKVWFYSFLLPSICFLQTFSSYNIFFSTFLIFSHSHSLKLSHFLKYNILSSYLSITISLYLTLHIPTPISLLLSIYITICISLFLSLFLSLFSLSMHLLSQMQSAIVRRLKHRSSRRVQSPCGNATQTASGRWHCATQTSASHTSATSTRNTERIYVLSVYFFSFIVFLVVLVYFGLFCLYLFGGCV